MSIDRRGFLKGLAVGAATLGAGAVVGPAAARPVKELAPGAVGILYDATQCIGCKACEVACKEHNHLPPVENPELDQAFGVQGAWDGGDDLDSRTMNKIKAYRGLKTVEASRADALLDASATAGDDVSFVKRACMHCVDPDCVSACPVSALTKDPKTGIVQYDPDACIGCRYCQIACPFNIPKFEYDKAFPQIVKCQMCTDRIAEGGIPACCAACPTGASLFGPVAGLRDEGHRRLGAEVGDSLDYPIHALDSSDSKPATVADYTPHIYGETETGGTQYMLMADVPFDRLGLPALGEDSRARLSETIQHSLYGGMAAPALLLGGLVYAAYRSTRDEHQHGEDDEGSDAARAKASRNGTQRGEGRQS